MHVVNSNTNAMYAQSSGAVTKRNLDTTLSRLSSGLRLTKAADDASGMAIADSLRTQSNGLGQAIRNANDAIGIIQIADKAMDEQIKILDTIRVKAIQSAQDGQDTKSRQALQSDIVRLLEELDNIAMTTTYNGKSLLSGGFANKAFQIGAYSNETIKASIGPTSSDKIGQTRFETGKPILQSGTTALRFVAVDGINDIDLEQVVISTSAGTGLGLLAEVINRNADELQVRASYNVRLTGQHVIGPLGTGQNVVKDVKGLEINGVKLGDINDIKSNDSDSKIMAAINGKKSDTGVEASISQDGKLELTSVDGRGIQIRATSGLALLGIPTTRNEAGTAEAATPVNTYEFYGRLSLVRNDATDVIVKDIDLQGQRDSNGRLPVRDANLIGFGTGDRVPAERTINLRSVRGTFDRDQASAMGNHASLYDNNFTKTSINGTMASGVTTHKGAQAVIDIAQTAIKMLDKIRADLGSVQIQLEATVNNVATTQTNVKFSESQIRDADYSAEITNFKKHNILGQASNYALQQSNTVQENVLRLLQ